MSEADDALRECLEMCEGIIEHLIPTAQKENERNQRSQYYMGYLHGVKRVRDYIAGHVSANPYPGYTRVHDRGFDPVTGKLVIEHEYVPPEAE